MDHWPLRFPSGSARTSPSVATGLGCGLEVGGVAAMEVGGVAAMEVGGVAAMEVVASDLKALGLYQTCVLSYDGVGVDVLEHPLTPEQRRIYDAHVGAFRVIHANLGEALKATGVTWGGSALNHGAKSAAMSAG